MAAAIDAIMAAFQIWSGLAWALGHWPAGVPLTMMSDTVMQHLSHARLRKEGPKKDMSQRFYQRLVGHLSGRLGGRDERLIWTGDRYRHLAQINPVIVEVRNASSGRTRTSSHSRSSNGAPPVPARDCGNSS